MVRAEEVRARTVKVLEDKYAETLNGIFTGIEKSVNNGEFFFQFYKPSGGDEILMVVERYFNNLGYKCHRSQTAVAINWS